MRGFTLIELMTCTLILALLTAIAMPGYRGVVLRANRSEARLALLRIQAQQERRHAQAGQYAADVVRAPQDGGLGIGARSETGHYLLSVLLTDDGQGYIATARAAPDGPQRDDRDCVSLSIDDSGARKSSGARNANVDCWR